MASSPHLTLVVDNVLGFCLEYLLFLLLYSFAKLFYPNIIYVLVVPNLIFSPELFFE